MVYGHACDVCVCVCMCGCVCVCVCVCMCKYPLRRFFPSIFNICHILNEKKQ